MYQWDQTEYFTKRMELEEVLASQATSPEIAAVHASFARTYRNELKMDQQRGFDRAARQR